MAKQKLDPATWAHLIRMMIYLLQMILGGIDPQKLEKRVKEISDNKAMEGQL